jgi:hypothetical protein
MNCPKITPKLEFSYFGGDSRSFIDALYRCFKKEFIDSTILFRGKPVDIIHQAYWDGKERSFWHIVSSGEEDFDRNLDISRCETLPWASALLLEQNTCSHYKVWIKYHDRTNRNRFYIWCDEINYIVIIEDRNAYFKLITAYPVTPRNISRYQKEYDNYTNSI